jgi:hypothetical protein
LQHASSVTGRALSWLPGWAVLAVLAALAAALAWQARHARRRASARAAPAEEADRPSWLPAGPGVISAESDHSRQEAVTHER